MAQLPRIGLYKPYINLPFGDCAMYNSFVGPKNLHPRGSLSHIGSSRGLKGKSFGMDKSIRCEAPFD